GEQGTTRASISSSIANEDPLPIDSKRRPCTEPPLPIDSKRRPCTEPPLPIDSKRRPLTYLLHRNFFRLNYGSRRENFSILCN
ncbi:unnamed protein product, partial [Linum tenue]